MLSHQITWSKIIEIQIDQQPPKASLGFCLTSTDPISPKFMLDSPIPIVFHFSLTCQSAFLPLYSCTFWNFSDWAAGS